MTENARTYQVKQYSYDGEHGERNTDVRSYDDLATHHPMANFNARMVDGALRNVERPERRSHAFIDGKYQEVEMLRTDEYRSLKPHQVLLIKDFILEDVLEGGQRTRSVDVPAPTAGHVSRRDDGNGVVEITDKPGGDVIARIRHLSPIAVKEGQSLVYGQSLGTQNATGLPKGAGKHVHIEMDTRHAQRLESYVTDLVSGRLPVQAEYRANVQPSPCTDDGVFRLGESNPRIRDLQRVMAGEGYRAAGGTPLDQDGIYRPDMQGALLDFQRAHGLQQTGNIDLATQRMAPPLPKREVDRADHFGPGQSLPKPTAPDAIAPGHPEHPDHRQNLTYPLPPAVNQPGRARDAGLDESEERMLRQLRGQVSGLDKEAGKGWDDSSERLASSALVMAKERGFTAGDELRLVFNDSTERHAAGEILHLARTGPNLSPDPAANRISMATAEALSVPTVERYTQVRDIGLAQAEARQLAQQQETARLSEPNQNEAKFTM